MKKYISILSLLSILLLSNPITEVFAGSAAHETSSLHGGAAVLALPGTLFGFSVAGLIMPLIVKENENSFPDLYPWATFYDKASPWATPLTVQQKTNPYTSTNPESGKYCAQVIFHTPFAGTFRFYMTTTTSTEVSTDIPDSRRLYEKSSTLAEGYGLARKAPTTAGIYDRDIPTHVIADISNDDCGMNDFSEPKPKAIVNVIMDSYFLDGCPNVGSQCAQNSAADSTTYHGPWLWHWVEQTIRNAAGVVSTILVKVTDILNVPIQLDLTKKAAGGGTLPNAQANNGRCLSKDTSDPQASALCDQRGAWTASFVPKQIFDKPFQPHAQVPQDVQLSMSGKVPFAKTIVNLLATFKNTKSGQDDTNQAACSAIAPLQMQNQLGFGDSSGNVPLACNPTPIPSCGAPPTFTGSSQCTLGNPSMNGWAEGDTVPGGKLPPTLIKLLEQAGEKFGVPPASILTAMYHEGAFVSSQLDTGSYQAGPFIGGNNWTDANVIKWSTCGQTMPNCPLADNAYSKCHIGGSNSGQCSKAIVGTGEIPYWFWGNGGNSDPWHAATILDPTRTKDTVNPCNLMDSIAGLTQELAAWGQYPRGPAQCYGRTMTYASGGSCSASSWPDDKIVQSHVGMWVGAITWPDGSSQPFCPDGTMQPPPSTFGANTVDPGYATDKVLNPYHAFSH